MRTEQEIRARIEKLNKLGEKKFTGKTKELIAAYLRLGERYGLWWVLGEVRKRQGRKKAV